MKKNAGGDDMAGSGDVAKRLGQAVDQLKEDLHRVEVWAGALSGFSHPVPDYEPSEKYALPKSSAETEKKGSKDDPDRP